MSNNTLTKENLKTNYSSAKALNELMIEQLAQVDLSSKNERQEFFKFVAGFKSSSYSLNNSILLYAQARDRSILPVFGTFNEWKEKHDVSIKRGSSALVLCMPHEYELYSWREARGDGQFATKYRRKSQLSPDEQKVFEKRVEQGTAQKEKRTEFFFNPCIFSLTQTTMDESARVAYLQRYNAYNTGVENEALYKKLNFVASGLGLDVQEKQIENEALGWVQYKDGKIAIKSDMPTDSKCAVLSHEIGHYLLHRENAGLPKDKQLSHREREVQAELFSHLIMENVGIDSEKQFSLKYISNYLNGAIQAPTGEKPTPEAFTEMKKDTLYKHLETVLPAVKLLGGQLNQEFVSKAGIEKLKNFQPNNSRQTTAGLGRKGFILE